MKEIDMKETVVIEVTDATEMMNHTKEMTDKIEEKKEMIEMTEMTTTEM